MTRRLALLALLAVVACRTTRPAGSPILPLTATTPAEAIQQLRERRAAFKGARSMMRIRATQRGNTQSFRAQLLVHDAQRMELIAYSPVGTAAFTLKAEGDRITTNPPIPPSSYAFLSAAGITPAETAMLLIGLPPREGLDVVVQPAGLESASSNGVVVTFEPPAFPAKRVIVTRGNDRVEIEHQEVVSE